ncbi:MAG: hypothetical protein CL386_00175 [Acidiferrobacter sp.]|nr:hypothetical protein [Acidiferrobacter sp.]|tara:strand:- start:564 stop:758 length:195 start_codon:yes stop_codon:yes gene_type:complete
MIALLLRTVILGDAHYPRMPARGFSLSIEVLLKMTNRMSKKKTTSLPMLIIGRMSMYMAKLTPL